MPYSLDDKLVIAVASSALFDLRESDKVFREQGEEAYRQYQRDHETDVLDPGVAYPFIRRLLGLNDLGTPLVEVVLMSRNDSDTGLRVMKSIESHELDISRVVFRSGRSPYEYIPAFNVCLLLSANAQDVKEAIMKGHPAGRVLDTSYQDDATDKELRIAFDFDGVLIDDEAETVFRSAGLEGFHSSEKEKAAVCHGPGPLKDLLHKLAKIQSVERERVSADSSYKPQLRVAIITARNAPAHERMIQTLRAWGITVDETFLLGGIEKTKVLQVFKPHIFFDDQLIHLDAASGIVPSVHVPFGIANVDETEKVG